MAESRDSPERLAGVFRDRRAARDAPGALEASDAFLKQCGQSPAPALQTLIADALAIKAESLGGSERESETIEVAEELFSRFRDATDPRLRYAAAFGLRVLVVGLVRQDRVDDAVGAADRLGAFFVGLPSDVRRPDVGDQLVEVGYVLISRGQDAAALPLLDLVVDEWGSGTGAPGSGLAVVARMLQVLAFTHLGDQDRLRQQLEVVLGLKEAALAPMDALAKRLEKASKRWPDLAQVLSNRIAVLSEAGRAQDAERAMSDFIDRFDRPDAPQPVRVLVNEFRNRN